MIKYYKDKIEENMDMELLPELACKPKIASSFTDWRYVDMRDVVEFCKEEDPHKPDFLSRLIDEGVIRRECGGTDKAPLTEHER